MADMVYMCAVCPSLSIVSRMLMKVRKRKFSAETFRNSCSFSSRALSSITASVAHTVVLSVLLDSVMVELKGTKSVVTIAGIDKLEISMDKVVANYCLTCLQLINQQKRRLNLLGSCFELH